MIDKVELLARYISARTSFTWMEEDPELNALRAVEHKCYGELRNTHPEGFTGAGREAIKAVIKHVLEDKELV